MDSEVYEAVITNNVASLQQLASSDTTVLRKVTIQEDNILHVAAKYDCKQVAEEILKAPELVSELVCQGNSKGDTPLHVAARVGSLETARVIINCAKGMNNPGNIEANVKPLRMVNKKNDTPLHDAVRNGHFEIARSLIKEDQELTTLKNDVGDFPLFIAVDKKHVEIAKLILELAPLCPFDGRNSMNALHAAVVRSQDEVGLSLYLVKLQAPMNYVTNMSYKHHFKFSSFVPSAIMQAALSYSKYLDFLEFLTEKRESALTGIDDYGWAPLHYAVHFGAVDIVKLFLRLNSSTAKVQDKEGMFVTHIAAREGEVYILEMLAYLFPDIWDLQDNKGQTVLHHAVANGKLDSVKFILGNPLSHDGLINQQDNEGNTALHLATIQRHHHKIFELMVKDSRVDKTITNTLGLTVIDILLYNKELGFFEKTWITLNATNKGGRESLEHTINKNGRKANSIFETRISEHPQQNEGQRQLANRIAGPPETKKPSYDKLHNIASINLLVTTLIATVSFAAGFTMPGGYKSDGPDQGMAILSRKSAFRAFVISNALAFCFSTTSMFLHYHKSFVEKLDALAFYTYITTLLTSYGITAMVIAFVSGTYAALSDSPGLAKAVISIGCSFFGLQLIVYFK